ncbi:hypothetical protein GCM10010400_76460 [Streptomyces aculeolatus]|uniref:hypothetical protein n=1 Tax=Streptomyces aculeolatus TaxID=270689 RepID=UPI001CED39E0|nr:hypothetical protein [Streptomyces aculeolatus]
MRTRPAVVLAELLTIALFLAAPQAFGAAANAALATLHFLLTTEPGAVLLGVALAATLLWLAASSLGRPRGRCA